MPELLARFAAAKRAGGAVNPRVMGRRPSRRRGGAASLGAVALVLVMAATACGRTSEGGGSPTSEPLTTQPAPAGTASPEPPAKIVALTAEGDVVVVDRVSGEEGPVLASLLPSEDPDETGEVARAVDLAPLPDGRVLVATCCAPASGTIIVVGVGGATEGDFLGRGAQVDPTGTTVAVAGLDGISFLPGSLSPPPEHRVKLDPAGPVDPPEDPGWSPDGSQIGFTQGGVLGILPAAADSLGEATFVEPTSGVHWASPVFVADGLAAVEQSGEWGPSAPNGPSRLVRVDPATGGVTEIATSAGPITDVAVDASGRFLLWVDDGTLRWQADGGTSALEGDYVAAAWVVASD